MHLHPGLTGEARDTVYSLREKSGLCGLAQSASAVSESASLRVLHDLESSASGGGVLYEKNMRV